MRTFGYVMALFCAGLAAWHVDRYITDQQTYSLVLAALMVVCVFINLLTARLDR